MLCQNNTVSTTSSSKYKQYCDGEIPYIDINEVRPDVHEIAKDYFNLDYHKMVFIVDINRVAEVCISLNFGFIGIPANMSHNFQKQEMLETGVKFNSTDFSGITLGLVEEPENMLSTPEH